VDHWTRKLYTNRLSQFNVYNQSPISTICFGHHQVCTITKSTLRKNTSVLVSMLGLFPPYTSLLRGYGRIIVPYRSRCFLCHSLHNTTTTILFYQHHVEGKIRPHSLQIICKLKCRLTKMICVVNLQKLYSLSADCSL
jgi:hypothetical protein